MTTELSVKEIGSRIYSIRGHRVMLDSDLAVLYNVETKALKRAVKRNLDRFPSDFMFELTSEEYETLRYQFGTSKTSERRGGTRYLPFVFTQEGVSMLSSVLSSDRAIQVNIAIMRAFVRLRELSGTHQELFEKIAKLERRYKRHDKELKLVFEAIRQIIAGPSAPKRKKMGFNWD